MFEYLYDKIVSIYHDKEPLINVIAWYGLETVNRTGGDEIKQWNCIIFLRSKHRPECYYAQGKKGLLISPAIAEMCGVFPIVREEDLDKITFREKKLNFLFPKASLLLTAQRFQGHKRLFIKKKRYTGQGKNTMN